MPIFCINIKVWRITTSRSPKPTNSLFPIFNHARTFSFGPMTGHLPLKPSDLTRETHHYHCACLTLQRNQYPKTKPSITGIVVTFMKDIFCIYQTFIDSIPYYTINCPPTEDKFTRLQYLRYTCGKSFKESQHLCYSADFRQQWRIKWMKCSK